MSDLHQDPARAGGVGAVIVMDGGGEAVLGEDFAGVLALIVQDLAEFVLVS